jgi:hypothetical protein
LDAFFYCFSRVKKLVDEAFFSIPFIGRSHSAFHLKSLFRSMNYGHFAI